MAVCFCARLADCTRENRIDDYHVRIYNRWTESDDYDRGYARVFAPLDEDNFRLEYPEVHCHDEDHWNYPALDSD